MDRQFASVLLLAATVSANSLFRTNTISTTVLVAGTATNPVGWSIDTQTYLDEDTGIQSLRVTHNLIANILASDVV